MRINRFLLALAIWSVFGIELAHGEEITRKPLQDRHFSQNLPPKEITHSDTARPIPPGLQRIMAEGAGRVANMTCADVSAFVAIYGARRAEVVARSAGASEAQIQEAKRCLSSSSR